MHKYYSIAKAVLLAAHEYRINVFIDFFRHTVMFFIQIFLWKVIFENTDNFQGYEYKDVVGYYMFNIFVGQLVFVRASHKVMWHIKDGGLSVSLIKPFSYFRAILFERLGTKFYPLLFSLLYFVAIFLVRPFGISISFLNLILFVPAVAIGFYINYVLGFIIGCIAFWAKSIGGLITLLDQFFDFLTGRWVPLDMLGSLLGGILIMLPFSLVNFVPLQIILGRLSTDEIIEKFLIGVVWAIIFALLRKIIWKMGVKEFESVGI